MNTLRRICLFPLCAAALVPVIGLAWFFFYTRDVPDTRAFAQYAPATVVIASDPCRGTLSTAIPFNSIGENLRAALRAAEVREDDPSVLSNLYHEFARGEHLHRPTLSFQVSKTIFCNPSRVLRRRFEELRTSVHLERRFSRQDLFTIYANRVYLAEGVIGVQSGSERFFRKNPSDLSIAEAALLAGLVRAPSYYSPVKHPDRALQRRNEVIDAMVNAQAIRASEGDAAKTAPLGIQQ